MERVYSAYFNSDKRFDVTSQNEDAKEAKSKPQLMLQQTKLAIRAGLRGMYHNAVLIHSITEYDVQCLHLPMERKRLQGYCWHLENGSK